MILFINLSINDKTMKSKSKDIDRKLVKYVRTGDIDMVRFYVEERKININKVRISGNRTLFMAACNSGKLNIVKYLYDCGADYNAVCSNGNKAIHYAAYNLHLDVVKWLHINGINDFNDENFIGETPLTIIKNK